MSKSTTTYWNALSPENRERWISIKGMEGMAEELTLSVDDVTGEYTRLTRFLPGANTTASVSYTHLCVPFLVNALVVPLTGIALTSTPSM